MNKPSPYDDDGDVDDCVVDVEDVRNEDGY